MPASTLTPEDQARIQVLLEQITLGPGLGSTCQALGAPAAVVITCSIGAINFALTCHLSGETPQCMSAVIGDYVREMQDRLPSELRNSAAWKDLLPAAAGTGRGPGLEAARFQVIVTWVHRLLRKFLTVMPAGPAVGWNAALDFPGPAQPASFRMFGALAGRAGDEDLEQLGYDAAAFLEAVAELQGPPPGASVIAAAISLAVRFIDYCFAAAVVNDVNADHAVRVGWRAIDPSGLLHRLITVEA